MTLQEARQKVAEKYRYETWEAFVLNSGKTSSEYGNESIELFRAHWEAVGVKKGMKQALEVVKGQITYGLNRDGINPIQDGEWIDRYHTIAAIEKLSN